MTVLDAHKNLMTWFTDHDHFKFPEDVKKLTLTFDTEAVPLAYKAALESLQESSIIVNKGDFWILNLPLSYQKKDIQLSIFTIFTINKIMVDCDIKEDDSEDFSEGDLLNLASLMRNILTEHKKTLSS